jgi:hypothetical protein
VSAVSKVGESQAAELVLLADEGNSVPVELFATRALRLAIERAARVNRGKDPIQTDAPPPSGTSSGKPPASARPVPISRATLQRQTKAKTGSASTRKLYRLRA